MYDLSASLPSLHSEPLSSCEHLSPYRESLTLIEAGHYDAALAHLDRALCQDADDYQGWTLRGLVLVCLGRYKEALASCDAALALRPYHAQAWQFRGMALHGLNRYREAYTCYDRALGQLQEALIPPGASPISPGFIHRLKNRLKNWLGVLADTSPTA